MANSSKSFLFQFFGKGTQRMLQLCVRIMLAKTSNLNILHTKYHLKVSFYCFVIVVFNNLQMKIFEGLKSE